MHLGSSSVRDRELVNLYHTNTFVNIWLVYIGFFSHYDVAHTMILFFYKSAKKECLLFLFFFSAKKSLIKEKKT